jgi:hypothetical protein
VLIRGQQLDGPNHVGFDLGPGWTRRVLPEIRLVGPSTFTTDSSVGTSKSSMTPNVKEPMPAKPASAAKRSRLSLDLTGGSR